MIITRDVAQSIASAYREKYEWPIEFPPQLLEDFDGRPWTIVWEEGPEEWVYVPLQDDHVIHETEFVIPGQVDVIPDGVFVEAVNSYSVAIHPS